MNSDWLIAPHIGIGRLEFGISPDAVEALAPVYGKPSPLLYSADVESSMKMLAELGIAPSPEVIESIKRSADNQVDFSSQTLYGKVPVLLEYRGLRLDGVAVEAGQEEANFQGQLVFNLSGLEVLILFERANGGPGRYRDTEAAFDNIAVSLYCFSFTSAHGEVRAMSSRDADFKDRSITLRREPYRPANELDQFVNFSFL